MAPCLARGRGGFHQKDDEIPSSGKRTRALAARKGCSAGKRRRILVCDKDGSSLAASSMAGEDGGPLGSTGAARRRVVKSTPKHNGINIDMILFLRTLCK